MSKTIFIGSIYSQKIKGKEGDYAYMIHNTSEKKRLLIYNENYKQWSNLDLRPGGGNAIVRPFRYDHQNNINKWPRSLGIPTGPGWVSLTQSNKEIIDLAFENIDRALKQDNYDEIWWSASKDHNLGVSIFTPGDDVRKYIVSKLKELCKSENGETWEKYFLFYS
ncbi:hypothetical protein CPAV1605_1018 [seawater metagenome]|uniref:Uncharacterized protein n=1 Tax=seawater metagenome TaxID=1561972 RepID=A0A5E8CMF7_9ZZZZ